MKKLEKIILSMFVLTGVSAFAQIKVGNNPTTMNANSILEVESTNKGLLLPRLALTGTANFAPLSAHVAGMVIFNTATAGDVLPGFYYNNGTKWIKSSDASDKENIITAGTAAQYFKGDKTWATLDKAAVGLGDVNNTTDIAKPISTLTQAALDNKEPKFTAGTAAQYFKGDKTWATLDKAAVGLGDVANTTDLAKPVSTLTQSALDLKAPLAAPSFTGDAKAETATAGDTDTSVATTAFVTGAITAATTADATLLLKGKIQLAGDLAGTAALPIVADGKITSAKILDATILAADLNQMGATTGQILKWSGSAWAAAADASAPTTLVSKTAAYTLLATDDSLLISVPSGGATVTLPAASASNGKIFTIKKTDDDSDVLTFSSAVKITETTDFTTLNYAATLKIQSDGANWWLIN